ncbi:MAG TPA: gephyrin-like molybdotransferase Glp [Chloroflexota bacterium]|nr:gephyrin-like molybdotransferase Glp [Chloroflexota bacterium]
MTESKYAMVDPVVALDTVLKNVRPLPHESVRLAEASGRVLAEDLYASADLPPFASSAVDGYAVISGDESPTRRVLAEVTAGVARDVAVAAGTAVRTMTGAPVARGADAVAMVEFVEDLGGGEIRLTRSVRPGENVNRAGQYVKAGQEVLRAGTPLGAPEVGLLAAMGMETVSVFMRPRVSVLSTGDELVEPWEATGPAQIRDSNRYALMSAIQQAGGVPVSLGMVKDILEEQRERITSGLAQADVLITSGGVSMGVRDLVKGILEGMGTIHFGRVSMKPGKPLTFATVGEKYAFGLPGFPVSSLVTFELFVRPALLKMQGYSEVSRPRVEVVLDHDVKAATDRSEFQRAVVRWERGVLRASTTGLQVSGRLLSMVGANALLIFAPGDKKAAGESIAAILTGPIK